MDNNDNENVVDFNQKMAEKLKLEGKITDKTKDLTLTEKLVDLAEAIDLAMYLSVTEYKLTWSEVLAVVAHRLGNRIGQFTNKEAAYLLMDDLVRKASKIPTDPLMNK